MLTIWRRIASNEIIDVDEFFEIILIKICRIPYRIQTYLFFSDLHNNKNTWNKSEIFWLFSIKFSLNSSNKLIL